MAYFAEINDQNVVVRVLAVADEHEGQGQKFLADDLKLGGTWLQTSYNTRGGVHLLGGTPLRKNYAGLGYTYDEVRDAFIPPKPYPSWSLIESSCLWEAPVARPDDQHDYIWNENNQTWDQVEL